MVEKHIVKGFDADITIFDPNKSTIIENENMASKVGWTPFHQKELLGSVAMTIVRGSIVMKNGELCLPVEEINKSPIVSMF